MRFLHPLLILLIITACGCSDKSIPRTESEVFDGTKTSLSPSKYWKVEFSDEGTKINITHSVGETGQGTFTLDWTNHPGSFTYYDQDDFVWVFDGDSRVLIAGITNSIKLTLWDLTTWEKGIPEAIADRLPKQN